MKTNSNRPNWVKWIVGTVIALMGAAGGAVAVLEYLDAKKATSEKNYERAMAEWKAFTPTPIDQNDRAKLLGGWHMDLDKGLLAMSLTGKTWDLRSDIEIIFRGNGDKKHAVGTKSEGIQANENVQWAHIGVADFDSMGYRDIRDAKFQSGEWVYRSHPTAAPGPGYIFAIKTSDGNVAKLQIIDYESQNSYSRYMLLRYVVYPLVPDPPLPQRK